MRPDPPRIELYDATLRDGMGGGGMSLTAAEKLRVVHALDELGVGMIEAGVPPSNPKEQELVRLLASQPLETAQIWAHSTHSGRGTTAAATQRATTLAGQDRPGASL